MFVECEEEGWICENGECHPPYVMGRPFVDKYGKSIEAAASSSSTTMQDSISSWSANCPTDIVVSSSNNNNNTMLDEEASAISRLGIEWTKRALGEHASIASFAAFTMALMSNQAPPQLIADALVAASDEYRHAQTSFEIASLLLGEPVEPKALSPSSHEFGYNISALALATAQEGCIGETLSALAAAHDVDENIDAYNDEGTISNDMKALMKEKVQIIVAEESRHAMLAWNTVVWACTQEAEACEVVLHQIFAPENLTAALHRFFPQNTHLQAKGRVILETLIAFIREKVNHWGDCKEKASALTFGESLVEQLTDVIIHGVVCSKALL